MSASPIRLSAASCWLALVWLCLPEQSALVFDEIIIGSGLAALGTVLGLPLKSRLLVIDASGSPRSSFYGATSSVPCAHLGRGGLGNFWHGVIPTGLCTDFPGVTARTFVDFFEYHYPGTDVGDRVGKPWLFVPAKPVRPARAWRQIIRSRGGAIHFLESPARQIALTGSGVNVAAGAGVHQAGRVWLCAGALHTPALLARSFDPAIHRGTVSDHGIIYLGLADRLEHPGVDPPCVERTRGGIWISCQYGDGLDSLCTLRPARFGFRQLDRGIEQRAVFGLPMNNALAKLLTRASPGLVSEALFNRTGIFPKARLYSAYAQVVLPDSYELDETGRLTPLESQIRRSTDQARANSPWPGLTPSRRPEVYIPGIHLHGSLSLDEVGRAGLNREDSRIQVTDASVHTNIGPEHHSFKMMLAAREQARSRS